MRGGGRGGGRGERGGRGSYGLTHVHVGCGWCSALLNGSEVYGSTYMNM